MKTPILRADYLLVCLLLALGLCGAAADETWKGTTDNQWSTTGNWSGNAAPGTADNVVYNGSSTANLSNWLGSAFSIKGILFTNPAGPVSINGASTLTLGTTGINMSNATTTLTLATPVALNGNQTWGSMTNMTLSVPGVISGSSTLTKSFWGTLYLSGNNTFTGGFTDDGGQVWINNSGALGVGPKTITVANNNVGAGLHLNGINGDITLAGNLGFTLSQQNGAIFNEAGNNVVNGNLNVSSGGGYVYIVANGGTLTLNGTVSLSVTPRAFAVGGAANGVLNGNINNSTGLPFRKLDAGTWTMTNNNLYNGYTTVEGGTLVLSPTAKIQTTTNITVFAGATLDVSAVTNSAGSNALFLTANQVLAGSGTINGSVSLTNVAQTPASLQPGSLNVAQTAGGMGVAGTLTISSNLVMGSLVTNYLELNTSTTVGSGVNDLIAVGGNLDPQNARIFVTVLSGPTTNTPYRLFNYSGSLSSAFNPTVLTDTHYTFTLDQSTPNQINVTVGPAPTLVWSASTANGAWDLGTTANWNNNTTKFLNFDPVAFDDTAATNGVTLSGTLKPASVTFSNAALAYTLQGSGKITGPTGLSKYNSGTLTITTTGSDYTGPVTISGGTVSVGSLALNGSASSLGAGTTIVLDGGTFQYTGANAPGSTFNRNFVLGPNGGTISMGSGGYLFVTNTISGSGSLTKLGSAKQLIVTGVNSYTGNTYINQYEIQLRNAYALGYGKAVVANGADLAVGGGANYGTITNSIDLNGGDGNGAAGTLQVNDGGTAVNFGGPINLLATSSVGTINNGNAVSFSISGPIMGAGMLKKLGTNSVVLTGTNNSYTGGTLVSAGTLDVKADGALGSGDVTVASGATLKLEAGSTHSYLNPGANLLLGAGSPVVNLAFTGAPCSVNGLSFDGGATFKAAGSWGAPGSGAAHTDVRFTGTGILNVLSGPASTTAVTSSGTPSVYGTAVLLTATVSPAAATGTVTFKDGAAVLGSAPVSGGQATLSVNIFAVTNSPHALTAAYSGDNNYNPSSSGSFSQVVAPAALSVAGLTAQNKAYDGTSAATISGTPSLSGVLFSDVVTVTGTAVGAFDSKTVGTGKTVALTGLSLSGANAGNYTLSAPGLAADITPASLVVTGVLAADKAYDGNTNATLILTNAALSGVIGLDDVSLILTNASGLFVDASVGTNKTVLVSGLSLAGNDSGNYALAQPTVTANITPYGLTVTGVEASDKLYDGSTNAVLLLTNASLVGVVAGDDVTLITTNALGGFVDQNVGSGKLVNISGLELAGASSGNYTLTQPTSNASITPAGLTVSGAEAADKVYDGTTGAALILTDTILVGIVGGDDLTLITTNAVGAFVDKNVGSGKTVVLSGMEVAGAAAGNYVLTQPTTSASITAVALGVTGLTVNNKLYDATADASLAGAPALTAGIVGGEDVRLGGVATASFLDKNVGTGKPVTVSGFALAGADIGNYTLTQPTGLTGNISPAGLTVTGLTAQSKVYDGTIAAVVVGTPVLAGVLGTDDVTLTGAAVGAFIDANVGAAKPVGISGLSLTGGDAGNYTLTVPTATADITGAASATALTSSPNPSTQTSNVTFTATVSSAVGTPGGNVVFLINGVPFSTNNLAGGLAVASTTALSVGTNTVAAQFAAQGNYLASADSLQQVVQSAVVYSQTNLVLGITNNLDGTCTLTFQGTPQAQYYVVAVSDLSAAAPAWTVLPGSTNTVTDPSGRWSLTVTNSGPQQFYRSAAIAPAP